MVSCQPVTFPNSQKHLMIRAVVCAVCGLAAMLSAVFGQSPDRTCRRVENNSNGREIWMWSECVDEPAVNLFDRSPEASSPFRITQPLRITQSFQSPQSCQVATWTQPGELSSETDQADSDSQLSPLRIPVAEFSAANGGGKVQKDEENVPEETGSAGNLLVPSEGKNDPAEQTVKPNQQSEQSARSFSLATGLFSLFGFLAGIPFCLLVLAVTLLFVLRRYGRCNGLVLRVEIINSRGASQALPWQDHFDNSSASQRTDPTHARSSRKTAACAPAKEQTLLRQVLDANIGLREQILAYEAGAA